MYVFFRNLWGEQSSLKFKNSGLERLEFKSCGLEGPSLPLKIYGVNSRALSSNISGLKSLEFKGCGMEGTILFLPNLWSEQSSLEFEIIFGLESLASKSCGLHEGPIFSC